MGKERSATRNSSHRSNDNDGLIVTDFSFKPLAADLGASAILEPWTQRAGQRISFPAEVLANLKDLTLNELVDARTEFKLGNRNYICTVSVLQPFDEKAPPLLAVRVQRFFDPVDAIYEIAAQYELTEREREALLGVSMGLTCKEVAERMKISPNTVKAFLRLIMSKMGVTRRSGIISKVLEYH